MGTGGSSYMGTEEAIAMSAQVQAIAISAQMREHCCQEAGGNSYLGRRRSYI